MCKLMSLIVCTALIGTMIPCAAAADGAGVVTVHAGNLNIEVNGETVKFTDAWPFIDGAGRTMVPVRFVSEQFGYNVDWDAESSMVTISPGNASQDQGRQLYLVIGSDTITITDGLSASSVVMDTTAVIINDRTYIPLRYVAELLGYTVEWDASGTVSGSGSSAYKEEYLSIINKYALAEQNDYYNGACDFDELGINSELYLSAYDDAKFKYALKDLNNDSVPELFIAAYCTKYTEYTDWFTSDYQIYDMYTMNGADAVRMFDIYSMGYRLIYTIRENNIIACYGGGGVYDGSIDLYVLPENGYAPQLVYSMIYNGWNGDKYYSGSGDEEPTVSASKSEWDSLNYTYPLDSTVEWHDIEDTSWIM